MLLLVVVVVKVVVVLVVVVVVVVAVEVQLFLEFYKSHKGAKVPLFLSVVLTDHLYQLYY